MGGSLSFRSPVSVAAAGPGAELLLPALRAWIVERTNLLGSPFLLTTDSTEAQITVVVYPDSARDDESYRLTTTDGLVRIDAGGPAGAFYGLQTLRQLLRADSDGRAYMPAVHVEGVQV